MKVGPGPGADAVCPAASTPAAGDGGGGTRNGGVDVEMAAGRAAQAISGGRGVVQPWFGALRRVVNWVNSA